jgi:hypothetical protein
MATFDEVARQTCKVDGAGLTPWEALTAPSWAEFQAAMQQG